METFAFAETHTGLRSHNEDWYGISEDVGLFAVADGVGGYHGGEIASRVAVETVSEFYRELSKRPSLLLDDRILTRSVMDMAVNLANLEVRRRRKGVLSKMGSTLSALIVGARRALIGHIGDSRIYRLRGGRLRQLTSDHSLVAEMQAAGLPGAALTRIGHIITRAVGVSDRTSPEIMSVDVEHGDRFLLCTDGLTDVVSDASIAAILRDVPVSDVCTTLVYEALRRGGDDNVTALFVEVVDEHPLHQEVAAPF